MSDPRDHHQTRAIAIVVEDEPLFRFDLSVHLEELGYEVLEGSGADDALRYLENGAEAALLLTDIRMPGTMDGIALAREVDVRWPTIGIVVISAALSPRPEDLPAQAVFLGKPFTSIRLREAIARARITCPGP